MISTISGSIIWFFFGNCLWTFLKFWYENGRKADRRCEIKLTKIFQFASMVWFWFSEFTVSWCMVPPRTSQEVCKSYSNVSVRNVKFLRTQGILPLTVINYNLEMNKKQQHQQEVNRSLCWKIPHMGPFVTNVFRKTPSAELLSRDFHHSLKTVSLGEWGGCEVSMWYNFRYMMLRSATTQIHSYSKQC